MLAECGRWIFVTSTSDSLGGGRVAHPAQKHSAATTASRALFIWNLPFRYRTLQRRKSRRAGRKSSIFARGDIKAFVKFFPLVWAGLWRRPVRSILTAV